MSLNEFTKALIERRSTKSYIPNKQVPEEILQAVLTAGQYAPSSMNQQKRFFTVIQDIDFIKEISDKTLQMMENGVYSYTSQYAILFS
ncbi:MAG: nitroreductase family protein [Acutalibacteraceae bacterium]